MTSKIIFGSKRLGEVTNSQLQSMLDKYDLGKLLTSSKTEHGAMGQTMFVTSTKGNFVLKGNPLYPGQLVEEKFFIDNIDNRTNVKVPKLYIIDDSNDIFGWNYAIIQRLEGKHLNSKELEDNLHVEEKLKIAELIGQALSSMHNWKVNMFGELDTVSLKIVPFEDSYTKWLFSRIMYWLEDAKRFSKITHEDMEWVRSLLTESKEDFNHFCSPTFVMGDFKPRNFLINKDRSGWEVSGVFDFTNAYFADPISDLIKMITYYIDKNEIVPAKHLIDVYFNSLAGKENGKKRLKVHMLHQRVLDWGNAKATKMVTWDDELSFSIWVKKYTDLAETLLE